MRVFQKKYEFLVCAVNQVPPFDAHLDWPKSIDGVTMENYVAWMKSAMTSACCALRNALEQATGVGKRRPEGA